jgi:hypothetical protein
MNFLELSDEQCRTVITQASARIGINANLIEKDCQHHSDYHYRPRSH